MSRKLNPQLVACCYQQAKTIERLLAVLADDLGDLGLDAESDAVTDTRRAFDALKDGLLRVST